MAVFDVLMQGRTSQSLSGSIAGNYLALHGRHHVHYGEVLESNYLLPVLQYKRRLEFQHQQVSEKMRFTSTVQVESVHE